MRRLGDLLPGMAAELGLEDELRLARAIASWQRLVEEHVPAAAGATELLAVQPAALVVSARAPIVAQELRLRSEELLEAFAIAPGGRRLRELRVVIRPMSGAGRGSANGTGR
jgi:hypothetical protein